MKKIKIGTKSFNAPESFAEATFQQKINLMAYKAILASNIDENIFLATKKEMVSRLLNIPFSISKLLTAGQTIALFRLFSFMDNLKITNKPFDYFIVDSVKYYLPETCFANSSSIEYAMSLILYAQMNNNHAAVHELIATLCRPERADIIKYRKSSKWNGDFREEYNTILAQERAKEFKTKLEYGLVVTLLEYYTEMLEAFMEKYSILFEESDMKPMFSSGEGCIALLEDIAETNIYGNFNEVCNVSIDNIYLYLRHKKIKAERDESAEIS